MVSTKLALLALVFILNPYLSEACLCNGVTAATCTAPCFQCGLCNSKCCSTIFGRDDEEPLDTLDKIILPWCPAREDSEESELANVDPGT